MSRRARSKRGERGGAPTLAVFAIFIVIISAVAIAYFQTTERRAISSIQQRMAADVARATASAIDVELTEDLGTAVYAAMYDVGMAGGTREEVEARVRQYLDNRILQGWSYSNLDVDVSPLGDNDLDFQWQPDGSAIVRAYLDAKVEHVVGPTVYGIEIKVAPYPRFERLKYVAGQVSKMVAVAPDLEALERELNESYACEGLLIDITEMTVSDIYGGRGVILG